MKLDEARRFVAALNDAIARAEAQGRDHLTHAELQAFAAQDDAARAELDAEIKKAQEQNR